MGGASGKEEEPPSDFVPNDKNPLATFTVTGYLPEFPDAEATITAEIFLDRVPITASNFIDLCRSGFYNGLCFHRVIPGFMNQFGCPHARPENLANTKFTAAGTGGPADGEFLNLSNGGSSEQRSNGGNIVDEHTSEDSNGPGSLSMANTGEPNTGGSQLFMNVADNYSLDWFSEGPDKHVVCVAAASPLKPRAAPRSPARRHADPLAHRASAAAPAASARSRPATRRASPSRRCRHARRRSSPRRRRSRSGPRSRSS